MRTQLQDRTYTVGEKLQGIQAVLGVLSELMHVTQVGTHVTAITAAQQDAPSTAWTRWELNRSGKPLISLEGRDLYHLMNYLTRRVQTLTNTAGDGLAHNLGLIVDLTFGDEALRYNCMLDTTDGENVTVDIQAAGTAVLALGTGASAITATVRIAQEHLPDSVLRGTGLFEPFYTSIRLDAAASSTEQANQLLPAGFWLRGLMFRAIDASAEPTAGEVDGLIRTVSVTLNGQPLASRIRWKSIRDEFTRRVNAATAGIGYLALGEIDNPLKLRYVPEGATLRVILDTATGVDADLTAITPAAGDYVSVTVVGYRPNKFLKL